MVTKIETLQSSMVIKTEYVGVNKYLEIPSIKLYELDGPGVYRIANEGDILTLVTEAENNTSKTRSIVLTENDGPLTLPFTHHLSAEIAEKVLQITHEPGSEPSSLTCWSN